ncbi:MAG: PilZ domain-containing protein [Gammaproteobacteria bacterium]|nr:PilZ domain-containing protein [Gammaproteobacteria bacterium]
MALGTSYTERRRHLRIPLNCAAKIYGEQKLAWEESTCINLSTSGVLMTCREEIPVGSLMKVHVAPKLRVSSDLMAEVEVVRSEFDAASQNYLLGARITYVMR